MPAGRYPGRHFFHCRFESCDLGQAQAISSPCPNGAQFASDQAGRCGGAAHLSRRFRHHEAADVLVPRAGQNVVKRRDDARAQLRLAAIVGDHFGPHYVHENRPGSFVSSALMFSTGQNGGLRGHDISNLYGPARAPHHPSITAPRWAMTQQPVTSERSLAIQRQGKRLEAQPEARATGHDHRRINDAHLKPQPSITRNEGNPSLHSRIDRCRDKDRDCAGHG